MTHEIAEIAISSVLWETPVAMALVSISMRALPIAVNAGPIAVRARYAAQANVSQTTFIIATSVGPIAQVSYRAHMFPVAPMDVLNSEQQVQLRRMRH